jgi:hypothetical protein
MLRAELIKLSTTGATRIALAVGLIGLLLTQLVFVTLLPALANGLISYDGSVDDLRQLGATDPHSGAFQSSALSVLGAGEGSGSISIAIVAALAVGLLVATTDYRFGGIVMTIAAQPRRGRVIAMKAAATALAAAALGVVFALISVVVLLVSTLGVQHAALAVSWAHLVAVSARGVAVVALLALIGFAVGMLVRSQLAGFLTVIAGLVAGPVVGGLLQLSGAPGVWARLLPIVVAQDAVGSAPAVGFAPPVALAILAGFAAVLLANATIAFRRRDV